MDEGNYGTVAVGTLSAARRDSIVKEFEQAITEHSAAVFELRARLDPLLRPSPPEPMQKEGSASMQVSEARQRLVDLYALTSALHEVMDRLEV